MNHVEKLLDRDGRIDNRPEGKINIRIRSSGFSSLLHAAVGLYHASIAHLLLLAGADPFALDSSGYVPFSKLCHPTSTCEKERAETISVLLFHCPDIPLYPNKDGTVVDDLNPSGDSWKCIQCGEKTLSDALATLPVMKNRAQMKKKHEQQLAESKSSIIDLIDPGKYPMSKYFSCVD